MLHSFQLNGYNIVMDVNSGAVHVVDGMVYDMIQLLPSSYNQMRTCTFNYETLVNIYYARRNHKLTEWHTFCDWISTLPYAKELIIAEDKEENKE